MSDEGHLGERIAGAAFPSFYVEDLDAARAFYEKLLGPTKYTEGDGIVGLRLGDDWLTLFRAKDGPHPDAGPRNCEFAIRVNTPEDVDAVYERMVELGAKPIKGYGPTDTWMYEKMRFACIDDPFGIRVDVVCPLPAEEGETPSGPDA